VQTIIALLFCLVLGVTAMAQGWFALLWVPLGFMIGLFVTARIAFPILLGLPRAIHLVSSGEMRAAVYRRLLRTPVLWIIQLSLILCLVKFFWPSATAWFETNGALSAGLWLGVVGILLSALSKKSRADFRADFDQSYRQFYVRRNVSNELNQRRNRKRGTQLFPARKGF
jgi:hypothetical protein